MRMVLIQYKSHFHEAPRDICITRDQPSADRHVKELIDKYPSYMNGEFIFKNIKYIKS